MEKTVDDIIKELQALKPSLKKLPVKVIAPNGEEFEPKIKMGINNPTDIFEGKVEKIYMSYE